MASSIICDASSTCGRKSFPLSKRRPIESIPTESESEMIVSGSIPAESDFSR